MSDQSRLTIQAASSAESAQEKGHKNAIHTF